MPIFPSSFLRGCRSLGVPEASAWSADSAAPQKPERIRECTFLPPASPTLQRSRLLALPNDMSYRCPASSRRGRPLCAMQSLPQCEKGSGMASGCRRDGLGGGLSRGGVHDSRRATFRLFVLQLCTVDTRQFSFEKVRCPYT